MMGTVENYVTTNHQIRSLPSRQQYRRKKLYRTCLSSQKHDTENTQKTRYRVGLLFSFYSLFHITIVLKGIFSICLYNSLLSFLNDQAYSVFVSLLPSPPQNTITRCLALLVPSHRTLEKGAAASLHHLAPPPPLRHFSTLRSGRLQSVVPAQLMGCSDFSGFKLWQNLFIPDSYCKVDNLDVWMVVMPCFFKDTGHLSIKLYNAHGWSMLNYPQFF